MEILRGVDVEQGVFALQTYLDDLSGVLREELPSPLVAVDMSELFEEGTLEQDR